MYINLSKPHHQTKGIESFTFRLILSVYYNHFYIFYLFVFRYRCAWWWGWGWWRWNWWGKLRCFKILGYPGSRVPDSPYGYGLWLRGVWIRGSREWRSRFRGYGVMGCEYGIMGVRICSNGRKYISFTQMEDCVENPVFPRKNKNSKGVWKRLLIICPADRLKSFFPFGEVYHARKSFNPL